MSVCFSRPHARAVIVEWPKTELRVIWNWPVFDLYRLCSRFRPGDDERKSFSRTRIGWLKVEVVRWP